MFTPLPSQLQFVRLLLASGALLAGCSGKPPALSPPDIDPEAAGEKAIELYDTSGDGALDAQELEAAPPVAAVQDALDEDRNGNVTAGEIAAYLQRQILDEGAGAIRLKCQVLLDGNGLPGATVTMEPAAIFADGVLQSARGTTDAYGSANISVAPDELADTRAGVLPGLYLIRVSKEVDGDEQVPARFNVETELGGEVARRAPYMPGAMVLELESR